MDKGPFRGQGQETKNTPAPAPVEQPQAQVERTTEEMPRTTGYSRQGFTEQTSQPSSNRFVLPLIIAVVVIVLAAVAWFSWSSSQSSTVGIDSSKYQVVSLSDGQVYFGTLSSADKDHMKLTDVYYLQPIASDSDKESSDSSDLKDTSSSDNNFKLVKFTDIVYGPDNEMIISRDQIIHYDNLSPEGKVAKAIEEYKGKD